MVLSIIPLRDKKHILSWQKVAELLDCGISLRAGQRIKPYTLAEEKSPRNETKPYRKDHRCQEED
jgi:hypothetical protein